MDSMQVRVSRKRGGIGVLVLGASIFGASIFGLGGVSAAFSQPAPRVPDAAKSYFAANVGSILEEYAALLAIPNRATDDRNIRRNAEWIRDALERRGARAELLEIAGAPPAVYGVLEATAPGGAEQTLGVYAHYDGQAVVLEKWAQSPWKATLYTGDMSAGGQPRPFPKNGDPFDREWRLYARSSSDDKASVMSFLAGIDVLRESGIPIGSNIVFLLEGEEEAGSPHLGDFLNRYSGKLNVDAWLIFDGPTHQSGQPQLVFGVRGITGVDITVYGANRYLHSGHYGNWAPNAAMMMSQLLASMKDETGRVTIKGFYDDVTPVEGAVEEAAKSIPDIDDDLRAAFGLAASEANNAPYLERMLLPSLNIRGLESGAVDSRARNVIPPSASVSIDIRLAKGNDPERMKDLVEAHIVEKGYFIVRDEPTREERLEHERIARVNRRGGYRAMRTAMDLPIVGWIQERARAVAGDELVLMPTMGGSLPLYLFEEKLAKPVVIVPVVNYDNNQHAPNENLRLGNLEYGVALVASLLAAQ